MTVTHVQDTSVQALEELPDLGDRQLDVHSAIRSLGTACNALIAQHLGLPVNQVTGRVFELRDKGLVVEACRAVWEPTGKTVIWWTCA